MGFVCHSALPTGNLVAGVGIYEIYVPVVIFLFTFFFFTSE